LPDRTVLGQRSSPEPIDAESVAIQECQALLIHLSTSQEKAKSIVGFGPLLLCVKRLGCDENLLIDFVA